jgi:hypothetical protein
MFRRMHEEFRDPFGRWTILGRGSAVFFAADAADLEAGAASEDPPAEAGDDSQAQKQRLIAESRKYRKRAQEAEARLQELEARALSEADLAEYRRLRSERRQHAQTEQAKAREYETLVSELADKHARELAEADRRGERLAAQLCKVVGNDRLKSALAARGVTRVDQAAYLLQRHVRVELGEGEPAVRVVDGRGEPIADATCRAGETITIERFVDAWLASEGAHFLPPSGDSGSGTHKGASAGRADIAELEADPARRYAFVREHGTDEYLRRLGEWKRRPAARR